MSKDTHNLLDDLAGGVEVDQTLVDLELVEIPRLGTLTARLLQNDEKLVQVLSSHENSTNRLAGGDLEDLGGETNGALDAELLVLRTVDEVRRDCPVIPLHEPLYLRERRANEQLTLLEVLDVAARERDADFVDLGGGHGGTSRVVFLISLSDVTHPGSLLESQKVTEREGECELGKESGEERPTCLRAFC